MPNCGQPIYQLSIGSRGTQRFDEFERMVAELSRPNT